MTDLSALGFTEAKAACRYPKILVFGASGTGKSWFAAGAGDADNPALVIDTEGGTDFYGPETGHHFQKMPSQNIRAVERVARALAKEPSTAPLVLDSGTIMWDVTQDAVAARFNVEDLQMHHWNKVKKPYRQLYPLLMSLPRPVIITAHEGAIFEEQTNGRGKKELAVIGYKPKFENQAEYAFDLTLRLELINGKRIGTAYNSRLVDFPTGATMDDPTYAGIVALAYKGEMTASPLPDLDAAVEEAAEDLDGLEVPVDEILTKMGRTRKYETAYDLFTKNQDRATREGWHDRLCEALDEANARFRDE